MRRIPVHARRPWLCVLRRRDDCWRLPRARDDSRTLGAVRRSSRAPLVLDNAHIQLGELRKHQPSVATTFLNRVMGALNYHFDRDRATPTDDELLAILCDPRTKMSHSLFAVAEPGIIMKGRLAEPGRAAVPDGRGRRLLKEALARFAPPPPPAPAAPGATAAGRAGSRARLAASEEEVDPSRLTVLLH